MTVRYVFALALTLSAAFHTQPTSVAAQSDVLESGTRVRVLAPPLVSHPTVGTVEQLGPDGLTLRMHGEAEVLTIPLDLVSSLERSDGVHSRVWWGALIGFAGGAVTGYAISACDYGEDCLDDLEYIVAPGLGLIAGGIGALIGSTIKREVWEPVTWTVTSGGTHITARFGIGHHP